MLWQKPFKKNRLQYVNLIQSVSLIFIHFVRFLIKYNSLKVGRVTSEDAYEATKKKIEAYKAKNTENKSSGPSGVFAELGDKVNERGERLNELNQKFADMNAASGDFLKAVKDYNERQARKKWWEF